MILYEIRTHLLVEVVMITVAGITVM